MNNIKNTTKNITNIFQGAMLLSLSLSSFTINRRGDITKVKHDADQTMVTIGKKILDSPEYDAIVQLDTQIYNYVHWQRGQRSLPFELKKRGGMYLIPGDLSDEVDEELHYFSGMREVLVDRLAYVYEGQKIASQKRLGSQANDKDYPSVENLKKKFSMTWLFFEIQPPQRLKDINPQLFEQQTAKIKAQCEEALPEIMQILRGEALNYMKTLISKLDPKVKGHARRLDTSYVEKMRDFFNVFEARNIANDEQLAEAIEIARKAISGASVEDLQDNKALRAQVRKEFEAATSVFDGMMADDTDYFAFEAFETAA